MNYILSFLIAVICLSLFSCSSSYKVISVTPDTKDMKQQGIFYSLPKNKITISFDVVKTRTIEGPYSMYASKYLGIKNINKRSSSFYKINEVAFDLSAEKDPAQNYFINLPHCIKKRNQLTVFYSNNGMLASVNTFKKISRDSSRRYAFRTLNQPTADVEQLLAVDKNMEESFDTIVERVIQDSLTIEKKILKKIMIEKTPEQKAKDAADKIMRIREERFKLLSGYSEVAYPEGAVAYMDKGLAKMENEYLRMFTGLTYNTSEQKIFTFEPTHLILDSLIPICRFSKEQGLFDTTFYSGIPVFIKIEKKNTLQQIDSLLINRKVNVKKQGIFYRVPETVIVKLILDDEVIASKELPIAQLGQVTFLPPKKIMLRLDKTTGSVDFIRVEK